MARERAEAIPDGRLKRVAQLVAAGPSLNVNQLRAISANKSDDPGFATMSGAAPKRHYGRRRATTSELLPDRGL